jgi:MarR-like DNA-binding transcriptional regulator SgrR of sgrS sRNA
VPQSISTSLAESYEVAPDFLSATFKLRQGIKFHNGDAVTPEDVQFTFEQYRGANAKILHDKTSRIDIVDNRTIRFQFKGAVRRRPTRLSGRRSRGVGCHRQRAERARTTVGLPLPPALSVCDAALFNRGTGTERS